MDSQSLETISLLYAESEHMAMNEKVKPETQEATQSETQPTQAIQTVFDSNKFL